MTIIVYDPSSDKVRVDRRFSFDRANGRAPFSESKVLRSTVGSALAFSGPCIPGAMVGDIAVRILDDIEGNSVREKIEGFADDVYVGGFGRARKTGKVYLLMFSHGWLEVVLANARVNNDFSEGCGSDWYNAYRAIGMSPFDAFQKVCELHDGCGDGYDEF